MKRSIALFAVTLLVAACGVSYVVPRSTVHLELKQPRDLVEAMTEIDSFLRARGFENLGIDTKMVEFLESTDPKRSEFISELFRRQIRFKHHAENITVVLTDFSDPSIRKRFARYPSAPAQNTEAPALEIRIEHHRPGGFGPKAHILHNELTSQLKAKYLGQVFVVHEPPPTNQAEYDRVTTASLEASVVVWAAVFGSSLLLFGFVSKKLLDRTQLGLMFQRAAFTAINSVLVTPLGAAGNWYGLFLKSTDLCLALVLCERSSVWCRVRISV